MVDLATVGTFEGWAAEVVVFDLERASNCGRVNAAG